jgi:hypothetical protein
VVSIAATTQNVFCSAMVVDASISGSAGPQGIALHMARLNPATGLEQ